MEKMYAKALDNLIRKGNVREEDAFKRLLAHLKRTGRMKLLPLLLRELRTLSERQRSLGPVLEVASASETVNAEKAARVEGISVKASVNPSLVRGWRLVTDGTLVDRSGKRALIDLYRTITR